MSDTPMIEIDSSQLGDISNSKLHVELDNGDMILNMGPQHPATHGTLRMVVRLDGERVISADPVIGYMHRGYEKLTEYRSYPQITTLINRIDWLSSFANEVPFIHGAEMLLDVKAPPRAEYIRTILTELSRISTFLLFLGEMGLQVGAITPAFYGFRDREYVVNLIESATGGRFHPNFNRIGGLLNDLPWGWTNECKRVLDICEKSCDDFERLVMENEIFQARTRGVGIITKEMGLKYGVSGSNIRASGVDWDLRRDGKKYLSYDDLDFKVHTHPDGDSFSRYWVRLQETRESIKMVRQLMDKLPNGAIMTKVPLIIKVPEGEAWVETENPLGQMGYYIYSKGSTGPFRTKIRSASFSNVSICPWLLKGVYVPDVVTILASLYFILGDIDR
jgi:NADH-quinone oxidoreductase subunit D